MQVLTKDVLEKLYIKDKISTTVIGEKYNYHDSTIFRKLKQYNIPIWGRGTFLKGIQFSEEHKKKLSEVKKGKPTKNQFKPGHLPTKGNKGMVGMWNMSQETKDKISKANRGES